MAADAFRVDGARNKWRAIFGPPEWASAYHAQVTGTLRPATAASRWETGDTRRPAAVPPDIGQHASDDA
ncbi:MAG: hypothetical protein GAK41_00392 [Burkholderia gladioli]|nr:MAG: hypothetical protein GAK41_00392 [Burkholderia gladioli]